MDNISAADLTDLYSHMGLLLISAFYGCGLGIAFNQSYWFAKVNTVKHTEDRSQTSTHICFNKIHSKSVPPIYIQRSEIMWPPWLVALTNRHLTVITTSITWHANLFFIGKSHNKYVECIHMILHIDQPVSHSTYHNIALAQVCRPHIVPIIVLHYRV